MVRPWDALYNWYFRKFVVQAFGATIEMEDMERKDVETIQRRAKTQCREGLRTLCDDLRKEADAALKEVASPR